LKAEVALADEVEQEEMEGSTEEGSTGKKAGRGLRSKKSVAKDAPRRIAEEG
jgi:hypothetical protein